MEDEEDEKKKDEKIQVVEKGGVHAKEEGTRQKSCGPDRPRERRFLRKNTEILRNPRGMSTKKHKKFEKKILGGGLRKNTEILRNPGARSTKKHKKFTPPYERTPTKNHRNLKKF